jgi:type IV pilus assembly protein PilN
MIRINLLPLTKRPGLSTLRLDLGVLGLTIVLLGGGMLLSFLWISGQVMELDRIHQAREAENKSLMADVASVRRLEDDLQSVNAKIEVMRNIREIQSLPVRYVDTLISVLPSEHLWFESFQLDNNGVLQLKGVAMDNQSFAAYVEMLRASSLVRQVATERTLRRETQDMTLVEFHFRVAFGSPPEEHHQQIEIAEYE